MTENVAEWDIEFPGSILSSENQKTSPMKLGLGSHIHNTSTQETQAGGLLQVQDSLVNKFQARKGYNQPISKKCIKIIKTLQAKGDNI